MSFWSARITNLILLGVAGGSSEIAMLRRPETNETWRIIASVVGIIFLFRWIFHLKAFIQSENTSITVKNDDEVKDLDVGIKDLELKESNSGETEATTEEYPMLNEAVSVLPQEPSGVLDRQVSLEYEYPLESFSIEILDSQPTGILHRGVSVQNSSPPPSPDHFFSPSTPHSRHHQLEP